MPPQTPPAVPDGVSPALSEPGAQTASAVPRETPPASPAVYEFPVGNAATFITSRGFLWYFYAAIVGLYCVRQIRLASKPVTAAFVIGTLLCGILITAFLTHLNDFKGKTFRVWAVSIAYRFVLVFTFACVTNVLEGRQWAQSESLLICGLLAFFFTTFSLMVSGLALLWHRIKRTHKNKPGNTTVQE